MSRASNSERDRSLKSSRNTGVADENKGPPRKVAAVDGNRKTNTVSAAFYEAIDLYFEMGNEHFKQKNFNEAIDCYSRSIAWSPTSVAFANRAMAYLKVKRYEDAENDCTEALNLDDRYVKAYSRRATARRELGKLKSSMQDSEFAMRLEPNNQELWKQYMETKSLYEKDNNGKMSHPSVSIKEISIIRLVNESHGGAVTNYDGDGTLKNGTANHKQEMETSVQDLASRAASLVKISAAKNITAPKSAYQFEVSWRALSDNPSLQVQLLKTIQPATLPQIFKNALSVPMLIDIFKCTATLFKEETALAVNILENLAKVARFDIIVMCLSAVDHSVLNQFWNEVFHNKDVQIKHLVALNKLRPKYCSGVWQTYLHKTPSWPKEMLICVLLVTIVHVFCRLIYIY